MLKLELIENLGTEEVLSHFIGQILDVAVKELCVDMDAVIKAIKCIKLSPSIAKVMIDDMRMTFLEGIHELVNEVKTTQDQIVDKQDKTLCQFIEEEWDGMFPFAKLSLSTKH